MFRFLSTVVVIVSLMALTAASPLNQIDDIVSQILKSTSNQILAGSPRLPQAGQMQQPQTAHNPQEVRLQAPGAQQPSMNFQPMSFPNFENPQINSAVDSEARRLINLSIGQAVSATAPRGSSGK